MLRNSVQPAILPTEVAFVEGREIVNNKKKRRGQGNTDADEEYFDGLLKQDMKQLKKQGGSGHNDDDDDDDSNFSPNLSHNNDSSQEKSSQDGSGSLGDTTSASGSGIVGGAAAGIDRMLKGKDGMEFISDIRCCLILSLIIVACTLTIGVYSVTKNDQQDDFYFEVCNEWKLVEVLYPLSGSFHIVLTSSANKRIQDAFSEFERVSLVHTSFIKQVTEYTIETGFEREYPEGFVTISDVEYILSAARELTGADFVGYLPVIETAEEATAWSEYAESNIGWLEESWVVYHEHDEHDHETHEARRRMEEEADSSSAHAEEHGVSFDIWRYQVFDESGSELSYDSLTCPMWTDGDMQTGEEDMEAYQVAEAIDAGRVTAFFPERLSASATVNASMSPIWTSSPPSDPDGLMLVNLNLESDPTFSYTLDVVDSS
ncbi:MAG: hypothetical protein SGARI_005561, partial [Bacillariaceae sp.]